MKKRLLFFTCFIIILILTILIINKQKDSTIESIIYFPIDPSISFKGASTTLNLIEQVDEDEYKLKWLARSEVNKPVYLRQDISLLFEDGRLKDIMSKWEEDTAVISQEKEISSEDSGHFESISFHHAEVHYANDIIKSAQKMSYDDLYVIASPLHPLESFKIPSTEKEKDDQTVLDHATNQQLHHIWEGLIKYYNIPVENYLYFPLTKIHFYNEHLFPNMDKTETDAAIGGLWEGLYKNYFLGINVSEEKSISPIGSSLPLVLISKDSTHIIILTETSEGDKVQFIQYTK
jgi:uncharacterized membrane-anchored protein